MKQQSADAAQIRKTRLKRLAERIDALTEKDARTLRHARDIAALRQNAAVELHTICVDFVAALNGMLSQSEVLLDPPEAPPTFRDDAPNLVQINVRGRILQITYRAASDLVSTEEFRIPYTLEGSIRAFNQELLDKDIIEEQLLFYTLEKHHHMWRFFDARTYRSGPFDQEYLAGLLEQLI